MSLIAAAPSCISRLPTFLITSLPNRVQVADLPLIRQGQDDLFSTWAAFMPKKNCPGYRKTGFDCPAVIMPSAYIASLTHRCWHQPVRNTFMACLTGRFDPKVGASTAMRRPVVERRVQGLADSRKLKQAQPQLGLTVVLLAFAASGLGRRLFDRERDLLRWWKRGPNLSSPARNLRGLGCVEGPATCPEAAANCSVWRSRRRHDRRVDAATYHLDRGFCCTARRVSPATPRPRDKQVMKLFQPAADTFAGDRRKLSIRPRNRRRSHRVSVSKPVTARRHRPSR